ncbi:MAG: DNA-binding protein [Lachnospiraceae bacterium]|uniref:hypothetical protein n=1 Tax=Oribacterium sp. P6A1 TaxID=1410612 RepID=UPI0005626682|nr:hypothetical protein [Oribacterium sp. P6A1]MBE6004015.1 DNA-binding protein [Lachnospiraceae bacterium]
MVNNQTRLMNAQDVKQALGVSESKAYKIIQQLNKEMKAKGYYTISGRVSAKYFSECFYGFSQ